MLAFDQKLDHLDKILKSYGRLIVAFSGGVDSTFLAEAAIRAVGDNALAVTAISDSYPEREMEAAQKIAEEIGIRLPDDIGDHRPGMDAAKEMGIRAPLIEANLTKTDIRQASKKWELKTWDKPAFACLSSRFPYGTRITREKLRQVDQAEQFLYDLGIHQFRVRHHDDFARVELDVDGINLMRQMNMRRQINQKFKSLGYRFVALDLQGYRSGSLNTGVAKVIKLGLEAVETSLNG